MSLLFWCSLVFLGVVVIGGIALITVRAIELFRVSRSSGRIIAAGAERIVNASEAVGQRAGGGDTARLTNAIDRLKRSVERTRPLVREIRRLRAELAGVRGAVPRK